MFTALCLAVVAFVAPARHMPLSNSMSLLVGSLLFLAVFTRTLGVVLLLALVLVIGYNRRRGALREFGLISMAFLTLTAVVIAFTPVRLTDLLPYEYIHQLQNPALWLEGKTESSTATRVITAIREYAIEHTRQLLLPVGGGAGEQALLSRFGLSWLPIFVGIVLMSLVGIGFAKWKAAEGISIPWLFSILYLLVVLAWPWRGPRFLYPIGPYVVFGFLLGIAAVMDTLMRTRGRGSLVRTWSVVIASVLLIAVGALKTLALDDSRIHTGDLKQRTAWVAEIAEPGSIIMSEQPQIDYIYGRTKTVPYMLFASSSQLADFWDARGVTHVLIAPRVSWDHPYVPRYSDSTEQLLPLVYELAATNDAALIYERQSDLIKVFRVRPNGLPL
jgi:hypothetical protein